jgi:magnesium chelatase family protein
MLLPEENDLEAAVGNELSVLPVKHPAEVVSFLNGSATIAPARVDQGQLWQDRIAGEMDFEEVKAQEHTKRRLEVAAEIDFHLTSLISFHSRPCCFHG